MAAIVATAMGMTGVAAATAKPPPPVSIVETPDGWMLDGLRVRGDGSAKASEPLAVAPGGFLLLEDGSGRFAGRLAGAIPDLDPSSTEDGATLLTGPLSYAIDHERRLLLLQWSPVVGATSYRVSINDGPRRAASGTSAAVPFSRLTPNDAVAVEAFGPSAQDGSPMATLVVIIPDLVAANSGAPAPLALETEIMATAATGPAKTTFTFKTFIPDAWVAAPLLCGGSWPFPTDNYFKGDNRTWNFGSTAYRTKNITELNWDATDRTLKYVGQTQLHRQQPGGTYSLLESRTASSAGMTWYGPNTYNATRKNFIVYHDIGNPFCTGGVGEIDYDVSVVVDRIAGYNGFTAWGDHDRAPNYEFYYQDTSTGSTTYRFHAWSRGSFSCLSACTQHSFSIAR